MQYEITFIVNDEKKKEEVKKLLTDHEAKIVFDYDMGRRTFVYPIKRENVGFYQTYFVEIDPEKISQLDKDLRTDKQILRYLLIRNDQDLEMLKERLNKANKQASGKENSEEIKEKIQQKVEPKEEAKEEKAEEVKEVKEVKEKKEPKKEKKTQEKTVKTTKKSVKKESKNDEDSEKDRMKKLEEKLDQLLKEE